MTLSQARTAAIDAVKQLNKDVGIPATLREIGVKQSDIPALAEAAFADVCTGGNPKTTNVNDIEVLYRNIY